jgi:hypothetical protein
VIYGDLPTSDQLENFTELIRIHTLLHEDLKRFFDGFPMTPIRAGAVQRGIRAVHLLPGQPQPFRPRPSGDFHGAAAGQAHYRGLLLQFDRPAVRLSCYESSDVGLARLWRCSTAGCVAHCVPGEWGPD